MKISRQEIAIIALTVALLLIVGGIALTVAGVYTEGFKHEFRHFYVTANGTKFMQDSDVVLGNVMFNVHYVLKKNVGYTVQVLPAGENFYYSVDGQWQLYLDMNELTDAFDIHLAKNSFIIFCRYVTVQQVLEAMYPSQEVLIPVEIDSLPHFKLVVSAGDGSQAIALTFRCQGAASWEHKGVDDVEIDPPSLVI